MSDIDKLQETEESNKNNSPTSQPDKDLTNDPSSELNETQKADSVGSEEVVNANEKVGDVTNEDIETPDTDKNIVEETAEAKTIETEDGNEGNPPASQSDNNLTNDPSLELNETQKAAPVDSEEAVNANEKADDVTNEDIETPDTDKNVVEETAEAKTIETEDGNEGNPPASQSDNNLTNDPSLELNDTQKAAPVDSEEAVNANEKADDVTNKDIETPDTDKSAEKDTAAGKTSKTDEKDDEVINEIEESNAEDAEDEGNKERHTIEVKEYDTMSLEALAIELEKLLKNEKVQAIKSHVDNINAVFKSKFQALIDEKKEEFLNDGGNEIDFYYASPIQKRFKTAYKEYRKRLNEHYQGLEKNLKQNLANKLEIIEELKGLINVEENINTTYKHFKELQERWRTTGPIPRDKYNNAWNSYHHHVEMFYDFLHLNRDLRDLDFKHNLEKKLMIIDRAEELAQDDNVMRAFRELQELHKMWKEELGPVAREHREEIWERFKAATKIINDRRQIYYQEIDKVYEKNLEIKLEIIANIDAINAQEYKSHNAWQKKIKEIEEQRNAFFNAGKVPIKLNESTWAKFKESVRTFNRRKNAFYKGLKKEQYKNLQQKLDLIKIAEDNKDSEDFEATTPLMKKIQSDWKKIGHVPRKDSDKIWKQFKSACNSYFDKLHAKRNSANQENIDAFNKKNDFLNTLKDLKLTDNKDQNLEIIKEQITQWRTFGRVPNDKRYIEGKFQKTIDGLLASLNMDKNEVEMIKFENKLDHMNTSDDDNRNLDNERSFIRKKIDEVKSQINQLENNLQFFTNVNDDNPLVKEVHQNIKTHKESLKLWKSKLQKIKDFY
ncbi:DUF349 domain-containing protein [Flavivirga sp. 57AJ16]|uniref:DUF349 domain-containing protein n=1 Tax=Flavivirga sp. 57AJ16 TaxID=3025307 RepID=UPI0023652551|nr:DUF349 domain-containing protein [Flavivirga sp. 57AJ16]MDD7887034.1 DUF349 domain-containing protein [Flavivirga sp. 57AJ16]